MLFNYPLLLTVYLGTLSSMLVPVFAAPTPVGHAAADPKIHRHPQPPMTPATPRRGVRDPQASIAPAPGPIDPHPNAPLEGIRPDVIDWQSHARPATAKELLEGAKNYYKYGDRTNVAEYNENLESMATKAAEAKAREEGL